MCRFWVYFRDPPPPLWSLARLWLWISDVAFDFFSAANAPPLLRYLYFPSTRYKGWGLCSSSFRGFPSHFIFTLSLYFSVW